MMVKNSEDLAAFQTDTESKGRFTFRFGGWLKLNLLSSQLPFFFTRPTLSATLTQILRYFSTGLGFLLTDDNPAE